MKSPPILPPRGAWAGARARLLPVDPSRARGNAPNPHRRAGETMGRQMNRRLPSPSPSCEFPLVA
jgi:hypothetical protein